MNNEISRRLINIPKSGFAIRLNFLMSEQKITTTELAKLTHSSWYVVEDWVLGKDIPPKHKIDILCLIFDVRFSWLLNGK